MQQLNSGPITIWFSTLRRNTPSSPSSWLAAYQGYSPHHFSIHSTSWGPKYLCIKVETALPTQPNSWWTVMGRVCCGEATCRHWWGLFRTRAWILRSSTHCGVMWSCSLRCKCHCCTCLWSWLIKSPDTAAQWWLPLWPIHLTPCAGGCKRTLIWHPTDTDLSTRWSKSKIHGEL